MGRVYETLDERLTEFLRRQHVFFVATAPLAADGLVNLSPKGLDTFDVLDEHRVAYLDLTGSGVETIAHLRENGRIVVMFCAFEGPPRIVRLHGRGRVVLPADAGFDTLAGRFRRRPGVRSVVEIEVTRIADSCGFGVPLLAYQGERSELDAWAAAKGPDGLADYRAGKNAVSLDGLPGLG
ncbi:MAG: pyridoxamine 5'-phosphate oxidase family protein [Actinomycetota bacterium]|nr:pyridoxamine 5'-phosphate oxidase family protein [Actinomycetota bacterium]